MEISKTPEPPYYAVIFSSLRTGGDNGYNEMADLMNELAKKQIGYLGVESVRNESGLGITISYWSNLEAIKKWKQNTEHLVAQQQGRKTWYKEYMTRICKVERDYRFEKIEKTNR